MSTIIASDLTKTLGEATPLTVRIMEDNEPLSDVPVMFNIHGIDYTRVTDGNGYASLNINLGVGAYTTRITFNTEGYKSASKTVLVQVLDKPSVKIITGNLVKTWNETGALTVRLLDKNNQVMTGKTVHYTINGVTYNRITDSEGYAGLNINLNPGVYDCIVFYDGDDTYKGTKRNVRVTVKSNTWIDAPFFTKIYGKPDAFQCAVYDPWNRLNTSVELEINGVTYNRGSGADGLIRLNINLQPGEYPITVRYNGDNLHNPSSASTLVRVEPEIQQLTYRRGDGVVQPEHNQGSVKTHIYVTGVSVETSKEKKLTFDTPNWSEIMNEGVIKDLSFTSFEINETDPRVKTAKFTTKQYLDLTKGRRWIYIANPFFENFGGRILSVDFDKSTKLYTYQCQDGRRQYISKTRTIVTEQSVYDILKLLLIYPGKKQGTTTQIPLSKEIENVNANLLSGLHPIEDYKIKNSPIMTPENYMERNITVLSYDRVIDKIMNIAHTDGQAVDVYFTPDGVCHIDPIDLDTWLNTGIRLTHQDLVNYKYGFDTTNIITGVAVKDANKNISYSDWNDLIFYFGRNASMIEPVTESVQTEGSNTVSAGIMSGKKIFDVGQDSGIVPDYRLDLIRALREKGHTVNDLGVGPNVVQSNGLKSSSKGHIAIFVCNGICCGTHQDFLNNMRSGAYHYDHAIFTWVRGDIDMSKKQSYAHDWVYGDVGLDKSITRQQFFDKNADKLSDVNLWPNGGNSAPLSREDWQKQVNAIVNGQFNTSNGSSASSSDNGETKTTTIINEIETYNKALDEVTKSVRDLLSFSIRIPLNSPIFKRLHTNSMLWTELPAEFKLGNLADIFKIMGSYKASGYGVPYLENRWYVEAVKIKGDSNGVFADITLNPFPSSQSSFKNAVRQYAEAYDQAFNQKTETTTTTNSAGTPRLGNDSTDTGSMSAKRGAGYGNAGTGQNFDSSAQKGYAQQGRKYYDWARQYNDPIQLAKALANRFHYVSYSNHRHANAEVTHNNGGTINSNCWDAARLVKCCFDAAGLDCVVITGNIYGYSHGWNAVKYKDSWYSFDLCFEYTAGTDQKGSNALRKFF